MLRRAPSRGVSRETTQEPLVQGAKEAFDFPSAPRHTRFGEDQCHCQIGTHLLQMFGGKISTVIGIKYGWNARECPLRQGCAPHRLAQRQSCLDSGWGLK